MYASLGVTCHLYHLRNDRGLLRANVVTRGMERTPNKSQHTKLTLEREKISPAAPAGIRTRNLSITSPGALTNKLSRLPGIDWSRSSKDLQSTLLSLSPSLSSSTSLASASLSSRNQSVVGMVSSFRCRRWWWRFPSFIARTIGD